MSSVGVVAPMTVPTNAPTVKMAAPANAATRGAMLERPMPTITAHTSPPTPPTNTPMNAPAQFRITTGF